MGLTTHTKTNNTNNMDVKKVFFATAFLLGLCKFEEVLGQTPPCRDDPYFQFGTYQWNGNKYTMTCAWLTANPDLIDQRIGNWCGQIIRTDYGTQYDINEKCPETCGQCGRIDPDPNCVNSPAGWHDSTGEEYDCNWYKGARNCDMWGFAYPMYNKTADQACCVCGGGCIDEPLVFRDSRGRDCAWYSAKPSRCERFGSRYRNNGYVANEACCACNGGRDVK